MNDKDVEIVQALHKCNLDEEMQNKDVPLAWSGIRWAYNSATGISKKKGFDGETFCSLFADLLKQKERWIDRYKNSIGNSNTED
jgi:hypothetical protein